MKIFIELQTGEVQVEENTINLCQSCENGYPECEAGAGDVLYGDGKGNDNICCCAFYKPLKVHEWAERRNE